MDEATNKIFSTERMGNECKVDILVEWREQKKIYTTVFWET